MPDGNDQDRVLTGERLLREIVWVLDRHGVEIVERQPTYWLLKKPTVGDMRLEINALVGALGRNRTLTQQRLMLVELVAAMLGGGGAGGSVSKA